MDFYIAELILFIPEVRHIPCRFWKTRTALIPGSFP